ncbi:MAG: hypothetical protein ACTHZX_08285 [Microbacterium sp.]
MSTAVVLGATGGVGVTTLVAASAVLGRGAGAPAILASDAGDLALRAGGAADAGRTGDGLLVDDGRYAAGDAQRILRTGWQVLVTPATGAGDEYACALIAEAEAEVGPGLHERLLVVRNAAFGPAERRVRLPEAARVLHVPFDPILAAVPVLAEAVPRVGRRTRRALGAWGAAVRRMTLG